MPCGIFSPSQQSIRKSFKKSIACSLLLSQRRLFFSLSNTEWACLFFLEHRRFLLPKMGIPTFFDHFPISGMMTWYCDCEAFILCLSRTGKSSAKVKVFNFSLHNIEVIPYFVCKHFLASDYYNHQNNPRDKGICFCLSLSNFGDRLVFTQSINPRV